jgi:hypothetical protein
MAGEEKFDDPPPEEYNEPHENEEENKSQADDEDETVDEDESSDGRTWIQQSDWFSRQIGKKNTRKKVELT